MDISEKHLKDDAIKMRIERLHAAINNKPFNPPIPRLTLSQRDELKALVLAGRLDDALGELSYWSNVAWGKSLEKVHESGQRQQRQHLEEKLLRVQIHKATIETKNITRDLKHKELKQSDCSQGSTAITVKSEQMQGRLNVLTGFMEKLTEASKLKNIEFDKMDLPLTKPQILKELKKRHNNFDIKDEAFKSVWKSATKASICANPRANTKKGEIFLKAIFG